MACSPVCSRLVYLIGLLGVEGFAVEIRFDPDRPGELPAPAAVDRRARQLLLEALDPLESGVDVSVFLHGVSVPAARIPLLFGTAHRAVAIRRGDSSSSSHRGLWAMGA